MTAKPETPVRAPGRSAAEDRPGFRRRILIVPANGSVTAELEDDWHRMAVTLAHRDGVIVAVSSDMRRWPWTTCPGATARLAETFAGVPLATAARRGERMENCTHLHDLTLFAAAHAQAAAPIAYDVGVSDPIDDRCEAVLRRNGERLMTWSFERGLFAAPAHLAGRPLSGLGEWIAGLDPVDQEAARILRWASIMAYGRGMSIPAGLSATAFPAGACFTFQPDRAREAVRREGVHQDLSRAGAQPLTDRADLFGRDD